MRLALAAATLAFWMWQGLAFAQGDASAQTIWRLLDYVAVDYSGAVSDGKVISAAEYAEMVEFTASIRQRLAILPVTPARPGLLQQAEALQRAVAQKSKPADVARIARKLGADLLTAYPTPLAPAAAPDVARAAALYREQCAGCHGVTGAADGANAKGLEPPPIAFTDGERAKQRSVFALYQVIVQGLEGTAMASFEQLPPEERWALAFHVGALSYSNDDVARGEKLWRDDATLRTRFPNLQALTQLTPAALSEQIGDEKARALMAFLRRHPEAVVRGFDAITIARARLQESQKAYEDGDRNKAADLALAAYLDGFEPIEPALSARDAKLVGRVEGEMIALRAAISRGEPVPQIRRRFEKVAALMDEAEAALAGGSVDWWSSFLGALTILLREGLEALLIVVAMIAFLRKADRSDVLPYVHGGWVTALLAGVATWAVATYTITISGASRELTEGFGSLIAAFVLVFVGIWMHAKAHAGAWQKYVREKLSRALSERSAWFLFLLAFIVVYREVFETILFFTALWSQGGAGGIVGGSVVAIALLAAIAVALLNYSRRLPISQFFSLSSILIAGLAVVLTGKGVSGLQEAGLISLWPIDGFPRIDVIGLHPTVEGLVAQLLTMAVMIIGFRHANRDAVSAR